MQYPADWRSRRGVLDVTTLSPRLPVAGVDVVIVLTDSLICQFAMRSRRVGARGVLLLLALISSFPLAARAQTPVQADKTNRCDITKYANSAISGHSLGQVSYSGGNLDACYEACRNNAACVAVVDNRHASPPYCSLKSMLEPYGNTAKDVYSVPTIKSCCRLTSITAGGQDEFILFL